MAPKHRRNHATVYSIIRQILLRFANPLSPKSYYEDPSQWLPKFEAIFEGLNLNWAIIGGEAALQYRLESRDTVDLDFAVNNVTELITVLEERGFTFRVLRERDDSPYLLQGTTPDGMHFDIYEAHTDFERHALERHIEHYASPEDVIVYKLMAWRPQDRDDIVHILAAETNLDYAYIEHWAQEWEVIDNWQSVMAGFERKHAPPIVQKGRGKNGV